MDIGKAIGTNMTGVCQGQTSASGTSEGRVVTAQHKRAPAIDIGRISARAEQGLTAPFDVVPSSASISYLPLTF